MTEAAPIFSIIIPAYNVSETICRAVSSVTDQNFQSYELIIVDDGSTDDTLKICQKIALENPKIKIFSKPNGGVSSARNYGLDHAVGKYVMFIDADDTMCPDSIDAIYKIIKKTNNPDLILCDVKTNYLKSENDTQLKIENYQQPFSTKFSALLFSEKYASKKYKINYRFMRMPVSKAYRREIIVNNNICFDEKIYRFEDGFFNLAVLLSVKNLVRTNLVTYDYIKTNSGSGKPRENIINEDAYKIKTIDDFLSKQNISELNYLKNFYYLELLCEHVIDLIRLQKTSSEIRHNLKQGNFQINIPLFDLRYAKFNKVLTYVLYKLHCYGLLIVMFRLRLMVKGGL